MSSSKSIPTAELLSMPEIVTQEQTTFRRVLGFLLYRRQLQWQTNLTPDELREVLEAFAETGNKHKVRFRSTRPGASASTPPIRIEYIYMRNPRRAETLKAWGEAEAGSVLSETGSTLSLFMRPGQSPFLVPIIIMIIFPLFMSVRELLSLDWMLLITPVVLGLLWWDLRAARRGLAEFEAALDETLGVQSDDDDTDYSFGLGSGLGSGSGLSSSSVSGSEVVEKGGQQKALTIVIQTPTFRCPLNVL